MIDLGIDTSSFRLDTQNQCLLRGSEEVALRPKAFAVLRHLTENAGQLVSKEDLLEAAWPGAFVGEEVLKGCIGELRKVFGDDPRKARFIQTYPRRGYRFIGSMAVEEQKEAGSLPAAAREPARVFGRLNEAAQLDACLEKALRGERQVVFVTGENGIGKTALVESFLARVSRGSTDETPDWLIAYGQCQELYGKGEAYMPVLEALERVGRDAGTGNLIPLLNRHAPTWLVQMSSLVGDEEQEALQRRVANATPGRMLREIAIALEALTTEIPMVLVLEDLHWSDYSTVDLISSLARRREPARLLLIGTYRPAPVGTEKHPLKAVHQNLRIHRQCVDLELRGLERKALEEYLERRLGTGQRSANLVELFVRLTDGNPLFLLTMVEDLLEREQLVERDGFWQLDQEAGELAIADSLQQMIQEKLEALSEEDQRLLEAASVAGMEFSAAVVASAVEEEVAEVERRYAALARRGQFLRASEKGLSVSSATRYAFRHALHQNVLYQRLTVARRVQLHRRIGEALEASYEDRPEEITAALATHFERGRTHRKAVEYHVLAAQKSIRRSAFREAVHHLNRGLDFMKLLPDNDECRRQELALQTALGNALVATKGHGVEEVGQSYTRACELSRLLDEPAAELASTWGLALFRVTRAEFGEASRIGDDCLRQGRERGDSALELLGRRILGITLYYSGEPALAREHLETGLQLDGSRRRGSMEIEEPLVQCRLTLGVVLWILGYPDQALDQCTEAVSMARRLGKPMSLACARHHRGMLLFMRYEVEETRREAEELLKIARVHGLPLWSAGGHLLRGWARSVSSPLEAVPELCQALASWRSTGARAMVPTYLGIVASAFSRAGDVKMGLSTIAEAFEVVEEYGERLNEAELLRLKGKLLQSSQPEAAEACFRQALDVARRQQGLSRELWAAMSLAKLLATRGEAGQAREILKEVYDRFSEGFETPALKSAKAFLDKIAVHGPLQAIS
ncbi:MAG: AAA family ATPase [bacterium]|nr:AAA family ATPase [bacterium]